MRIPEKYKTLANNTGLLFIGTFGSKVVSFVMLPFYTSWLSVEDFGTSDIINSYSTILVALISLCIAEAVFVIPTGRTSDEQKKFFSSSLVFGLISCAVLMMLYLLIHLIWGTSSLSFISNIGYITLLCGTTIYMSITQQFCKCVDKVFVFAFAGIVNTICVAVLGFILIQPFGLIGYVSSLVIANILSIIYVLVHAKLYEYISIKAISKSHLVELLKYSVPLIPNSVIWLIVNYINRPIMETYMGMAAIGLFSLANRFPGLMTTVYGNLSNSWQISVLREYGKEGYETFYNKTCLAVFVVLCFLVSVISVVIGPVIHLLFNENYYSTIDYIPWLCLSVPFIALSSIVGSNFSAIRQSKYYFYSSVWSAATAILCNIILIPLIGLWGACIANVMSFFIGAVSRIYYSRHIAHFRWGAAYILVSLLTIVNLLLTYHTHTILWTTILISLQLSCMLVYFMHHRNSKG